MSREEGRVPASGPARMFFLLYLASQIAIPMVGLVGSRMLGVPVRMGWHMFAAVVGCPGE